MFVTAKMKREHDQMRYDLSVLQEKVRSDKESYDYRKEYFESNINILTERFDRLLAYLDLEEDSILAKTIFVKKEKEDV